MQVPEAAAFAEYARDGQSGRAVAGLLWTKAKQVAASGLPTLTGGPWDADAVDELCGEFVGRAGFAGQMRELFLLAPDADRFGALTYTAVRQFHQQRLRTTPSGKMHRRLKGVLGDADTTTTLARTPAGTAVADPTTLPADPWSGDVGDLLDAASAVAVERREGWSSDKRDSPVITDRSLVAVIEAIVEAAGAPVLLGDVLAVLRRTFGMYPDRPPTPLAVQQVGPDQRVVTRATASQLWGELTDEDRALLANHGTRRQIAENLGISKSAAQRRYDGLMVRLETMRDRGDLDSDVMLELFEIAHHHPSRDTS